MVRGNSNDKICCYCQSVYSTQKGWLQHFIFHMITEETSLKYTSYFVLNEYEYISSTTHKQFQKCTPYCIKRQTVFSGEKKKESQKVLLLHLQFNMRNQCYMDTGVACGCQHLIQVRVTELGKFSRDNILFGIRHRCRVSNSTKSSRIAYWLSWCYLHKHSQPYTR